VIRRISVKDYLLPYLLTYLLTFCLGQFAVKKHVDFAVRLHQLHRALTSIGRLQAVWNLHASDGNPGNYHAWSARGLMICFNEVRGVVLQSLLAALKALRWSLAPRTYVVRTDTV